MHRLDSSQCTSTINVALCFYFTLIYSCVCYLNLWSLHYSSLMWTSQISAKRWDSIIDKFCKSGLVMIEVFIKPLLSSSVYQSDAVITQLKSTYHTELSFLLRLWRLSFIQVDNQKVDLFEMIQLDLLVLSGIVSHLIQGASSGRLMIWRVLSITFLIWKEINRSITCVPCLVQCSLYFPPILYHYRWSHVEWSPKMIVSEVLECVKLKWSKNIISWVQYTLSNFEIRPPDSGRLLISCELP